MFRFFIHSMLQAGGLLLTLASCGFGQGLGLDDLIRMGLERNRALAVVRQETVTASIDTLTVSSAVNPHLEVEAMHNLTEPDKPSAGFRLSRVFQPGVRSRMKQASKTEWEARRHWLKVREVEVTEEIRTAFYEWQILSRRAGLQREVIERWERLAKLAASQVAQGKLSEVDLSEAQLNAIKARQSELALLSERESREPTLRVLTGQNSPPVPLEWDRLDSLPALPSLDTLMVWAYRSSPTLAARRKEQEAGKFRLNLAERNALPPFSVFIGYDREPDGHHMLGAGFEMELAYLNRNQAGISKARSGLREADLRETAAEEALRAEIGQVHGRLTRLAERYGRFQKEIRDLLRKQMALSEKGFQQGMLGVFDLSRVQAEHLDQEGEALGILEEYYREWSRLDRSVGGML